MDTTKSPDAGTSAFWSAARTCAHENGIRPQLNISGERGLEKQGINGMDLPGAKLDDAEESQSFEDSEMEDRSEDGNEDQVGVMKPGTTLRRPRRRRRMMRKPKSMKRR